MTDEGRSIRKRKRGRSTRKRELAKHIVTIYCDGTDSTAHERFVVAQYGLFWVIPNEVGDCQGWWQHLEQWEYGGRSGRTQRSEVTIRNGGLAPSPSQDELRAMIGNADSVDDVDIAVTHVLSCPQCRFRRNIKDTARLLLALDSVASTVVVELNEASLLLLGSGPEALDLLIAWHALPGDEIEVRQLVARAELLGQLKGRREG